ncbi:hypothetical protein FRC09_009242, partial [Ceratobasidium sp. 395]
GRDIIAQWIRRPKPLSGLAERECVSLCYHVWYGVTVVSELECDQIYYHRCVTARSNPHSFWGYFSTNRDPQIRDDSIKKMGWRFRHGLTMRMWRVVDDWGYKYKKLLAESLRDCPDSFLPETIEDDREEE